MAAPAPPGKLTGKARVITGATSGIGLATARLFSTHGARLAIMARDTRAVQSTAAELAPDTVTVTGDVARVDDLAALMHAANDAPAPISGHGICRHGCSATGTYPEARPSPARSAPAGVVPCAATQRKWSSHAGTVSALTALGSSSGPTAPRKALSRSSCLAAAPSTRAKCGS
jgi:NAD(P)-dependent dehydrogenase (short-subunit alcohol dehydrogenase family)